MTDRTIGTSLWEARVQEGDNNYEWLVVARDGALITVRLSQKEAASFMDGYNLALDQVGLLGVSRPSPAATTSACGATQELTPGGDDD